MEGAKQLGRLNHDAWSEIQEADTRVCQGLVQPSLDRQRQCEQVIFDQFGNFPTRYDADAKPLRFARLKVCVVSCGELLVSMNPPDPDMRIQHDHCVATQSASATGLVGSI